MLIRKCEAWIGVDKIEFRDPGGVTLATFTTDCELGIALMNLLDPSAAKCDPTDGLRACKCYDYVPPTDAREPIE